MSWGFPPEICTATDCTWWTCNSMVHGKHDGNSVCKLASPFRCYTSFNCENLQLVFNRQRKPETVIGWRFRTCTLLRSFNTKFGSLWDAALSRRCYATMGGRGLGVKAMIAEQRQWMGWMARDHLQGSGKKKRRPLTNNSAWLNFNWFPDCVWQCVCVCVHNHWAPRRVV